MTGFRGGATVGTGGARPVDRRAPLTRVNGGRNVNGAHTPLTRVNGAWP